MKFKSTWIVAGIFLALAAYLFLVDDPRQDAQQAAEEQEGLLFPDLDIEQINALHLKNPHGEATVTRGEHGGWQVVQPWQDRANEARIEALLSDLKALRSERQIAGADADLEPFGLDAPEVTVQTDGPGEISLAVGSQNPAGDARYLRVGEGPVRVAKNPLLSGFQLQLEDLRSPDVVGEFPWEEISALEVGSEGDATVRLEKEQGAWWLRTPIQGEADAEAVQRLTDKLRWAKINTFLSPEAGKAEERLAAGTRVTLEAGPDTSVTVRLARVEDQVWAHRSGRDATFTVPGDVLEVFAVEPGELRRRRPVLVKAWKVDRVELERGGDRRVYEKSDGDWQRDGSQLEEAEAQALQHLLDALENTAAEEVVSEPQEPAEYGLEAPALSVSLTTTDEAEHAVLLGRTENGLFARSGSAGPVYRMPAEYGDKADALFAPFTEESPSSTSGE